MFSFLIMNTSTNASNLVFSLFVLFLLLAQTAEGSENNDIPRDHDEGIRIGVIVDESSRIGKEERVAMEIAVGDVYSYTKQSIVLNVKDSRREVPHQAALAAQQLISDNVRAILGPATWEETSLVAEISSKNQVPVLSFADTTPEWATKRWPTLFQFSPNKNAQTKAIAEILQSWNWHQIALIYEDSDFSANSIITHLSSALREVNSEIKQFVALSPFSSLSSELDKLNEGDCRVFLVHLSLPLAERLFKTANQKNMMEKDYVWITTDAITSLVHSINASANAAMQGVVGVLSYFFESVKPFQEFHTDFRKRFSTKYPAEDKNEPGIFAVLAYDAVRTVALALNQTNNSSNQVMLEKIEHTNFNGLSGKVEFINRKVAAAKTFQIVNILGRSYNDIGYWTNGSGFSKDINRNVKYSSSMKDLGRVVVWPGRSSETPRGWTIPNNTTTPLRVGVPAHSGYTDYVKVEYHEFGEKSFSGLAIELFNETVKALQLMGINLPFTFVDFNGTHNELVGNISEKKIDIAVGDIAIVSERYEHAEFTHPYTETGLRLVVPAETKLSNKAWLFLKPFTATMWAFIVLVNIYNGFVVWLIEPQEPQDNSEKSSGPFNQIGNLLWLSFNTLFSLQGGKLKSNLSRLSMLVWLFVALVITQTYTANLASMLTVRRLVPTVTGLDELIKNNAPIGYCHGSYMKNYLANVLGVPEGNLKSYSALEQYAEAFERKEISAAFLEASLAKPFLSRYCGGYTTAGPTYKVGGYGFAVPRGSPLLPNLNQALLNVCETGKLLDLEKRFITTNNCSNIEVETDNTSLSPSSFQALFIITGGTSTLSLLVYIFRAGSSMFGPKAIWRLMLAVRKYLFCQNQRFMRRVSDSQSPGNASPVINSNIESQVKSLEISS